MLVRGGTEETSTFHHISVKNFGYGTTTLDHMALQQRIWTTILMWGLVIHKGQSNSSYDPNAILPEIFVLEEPHSATLQVVAVLAVIGAFCFIYRLYHYRIFNFFLFNFLVYLIIIIFFKVQICRFVFINVEKIKAAPIDHCTEKNTSH